MNRRRPRPADTGAMGLFCYGTLQVTAIMAAVTGRTFPARSARLHGYARYRLGGVDYPGIIAQPGGVVDGLLYQDIDPITLQRLDRFEGQEYQRCCLPVDLESGSTMAQVYRLHPKAEGLLSTEPWDLATFCRIDLARFLAQLRHP